MTSKELRQNAAFFYENRLDEKVYRFNHFPYNFRSMVQDLCQNTFHVGRGNCGF